MSRYEIAVREAAELRNRFEALMHADDRARQEMLDKWKEQDVSQIVDTDPRKRGKTGDITRSTARRMSDAVPPVNESLPLSHNQLGHTVDAEDMAIVRKMGNWSTQLSNWTSLVTQYCVPELSIIENYSEELLNIFLRQASFVFQS